MLQLLRCCFRKKRGKKVNQGLAAARHSFVFFSFIPLRFFRFLLSFFASRSTKRLLTIFFYKR